MGGTSSATGCIMCAPAECTDSAVRYPESFQNGMTEDRIEAVSHNIAEVKFIITEKEIAGEGRTVGEDGKLCDTGIASSAGMRPVFIEA